MDPRKLLQAAMAHGGSTAAPSDAVGIPGAASPAGGAAVGPQGGLQDALPSGFAGAQPVGAESSGVLSTGGLQNELGVGAEQADAGDPAAAMVQEIQNPQTSPAEKAMLQQQLQLAALRALTAGSGGAVGSPS